MAQKLNLAESSSVLLVGADERLIGTYARFIAASNLLHLVGVANNAKNALQLFLRHRPKIVVLDFWLDTGAGREALARSVLQVEPATSLVYSLAVATATDLPVGGCVDQESLDSPKNHGLEPRMLVKSPDFARVLNGEQTTVVDERARKQLPPRGPTAWPVRPPTRAERDVLSLICSGLDYAEIAGRRRVSIATVKSQARQLREKFNANSLAQLVVRAVQLGYFKD